MHSCPSLWAGTNAGHIYVFYLAIPDAEKRTEEEVQVEIGKEIKLKHKAPVVSMFVVDKDGMPLLGDVMQDQGKGNKFFVLDDLNLCQLKTCHVMNCTTANLAKCVSVPS